MNKQTSPAPSTSQLLFYKDPQPLRVEKHSGAGLSVSADFTFSKTTNSVPITLQEFVEICKTYPIVFASNETADPVAVLGFENNKNLFVGPNGNWVREAYIPAYIRRYPFAFMEADDKLILCIDESSNRFIKKAKKN